MKETIYKFAWECLKATRIIVRHPRFFLISGLVLSLGIGMSTAVFSIRYGVLLKRLPVQEQNRVVVAWKGDPKDVAHIGELSYPEFQDWQRQHAGSSAPARGAQTTRLIDSRKNPADKVPVSTPQCPNSCTFAEVFCALFSRTRGALSDQGQARSAQ